LIKCLARKRDPDEFHKNATLFIPVDAIDPYAVAEQDPILTNARHGWERLVPTSKKLRSLRVGAQLDWEEPVDHWPQRCSKVRLLLGETLEVAPELVQTEGRFFIVHLLAAYARRHRDSCGGYTRDTRSRRNRRLAEAFASRMGLKEIEYLQNALLLGFELAARKH
jgi:hypothetical protein